MQVIKIVFWPSVIAGLAWYVLIPGMDGLAKDLNHVVTVFQNLNEALKGN